MKIKIFLLGLATLGMVSCGTEQTQEGQEASIDNVEAKVEVVEKKVASTENKMVANIGVENMTCVMGCGGTIKGALGKLEGVVSTDFDFEDERAVNRAIIEFDPAKVSMEEMITAISTVHEGTYGVTDAVKEEHFVEGDEAVKEESTPTESL